MFRDTHHGKPCAYCSRLMDRASFHLQPTRDHIKPASLGGRETLICCVKCNGIKGNMLPLTWVIYMIENPGWWKLTARERRGLNRHGARLGTFRSVARQGTAPLPPVVVPPALIFGGM